MPGEHENMEQSIFNVEQPIFYIEAGYGIAGIACAFDLLALAVGQTRVMITTDEQEATAYVGVFDNDNFDVRKDKLTGGEGFRRKIPIYLIDDDKEDVQLVTPEAYGAGLTFYDDLDIVESTPLVANGEVLHLFRFVFPALDEEYTTYSVDLARATAVLDEALPALGGAYEVERLDGKNWVHLDAQEA